MVILEDIATTDFSAYHVSNKVEIARVDLFHKDRFYDRCCIRGRVTTAFSTTGSVTTFTALAFFADQHHHATSTVGYDALQIGLSDSSVHLVTTKSFAGISSKALAVDNWETFMIHPVLADIASDDTYFVDNRLIERYVSFKCTHDLTTDDGTIIGIVKWDAILTSSDNFQPGGVG